MNGAGVSWTKTGSGRWEADLADKRLIVTRVIRQRSWSYSGPFVSIGRKPRHYSSCSIVDAVVKIGNEWHRLKRPEGIYSVRDAKAAAILYAVSGEGDVTINRIED